MRGPTPCARRLENAHQRGLEEQPKGAPTPSPVGTDQPTAADCLDDGAVGASLRDLGFDVVFLLADTAQGRSELDDAAEALEVVAHDLLLTALRQHGLVALNNLTHHYLLGGRRGMCAHVGSRRRRRDVRVHVERRDGLGASGELVHPHRREALRLCEDIVDYAQRVVELLGAWLAL